MNPDEFKALMAKIAQNADNQGLVTELSTQAIEAFSGVSTTLQGLTEQTQKQTDQINSLKEKNMELFLKVAQPIPPAKDQQLQQPENDLTYDKLLESMGVK